MVSDGRKQKQRRTTNVSTKVPKKRQRTAASGSGPRPPVASAVVGGPSAGSSSTSSYTSSSSDSSSSASIVPDKCQQRHEQAIADRDRNMSQVMGAGKDPPLMQQPRGATKPRSITAGIGDRVVPHNNNGGKPSDACVVPSGVASKPKPGDGHPELNSSSSDSSSSSSSSGSSTSSVLGDCDIPSKDGCVQSGVARLVTVGSSHASSERIAPLELAQRFVSLPNQDSVPIDLD